MWIQGLMDDLDLSSRESETSNKKTVWDDSVHILCKVLLHPDLDNITTEAADPIVGDLTYLNNDIRVFWALRVIGNTILCLFPHAATVSFWSTWPILPTKPMKSSVMQIFHLPPYCASAINSAIASTTNAAVLLSQPPPLSPGRVDEPIPQTKSKVGTSKAVQKPKPKQPANAKKPKISQVAATRTDSTMTTQFVDSRHPRRPVAKRGYEEVSGSDS
ncbi:hypothetical protein BDR26DRAFT_883553 [Obelidium mucronatum]|nr:hypothetical protein BDR26DRAFT_883553 [Obelidium mucronatum]